MTAERLVVIGGDAAGMSAASQARRLKGPEELSIVAFERGHFTSYSACGIPYWVSGDVAERDALIARSPEEHRARAIDLRMRTEVTEIDVAGQRVRALDRESGETYWTGFDKLVIATGARPVRPALPGMDAAGVHGVQTLDDGQALLDSLDRAPGRRAVVVGAGYIGVEMAEALLKHGFQVTVLNRGEQPMATLDPDMGRLVHDAMDGLGITTVNRAEVTKILTGADGRVTRSPRTTRPTRRMWWCSASVSNRRRHWPARPTCRSARTAVCSPICRCGSSDTTTSGRAATASRSSTSWRAAPAISRWAPMPTNTARSSGPMSAAATGRSRGWWAPRSARSAIWRSPGRGCARRTPARWGCGSSRRRSSRRAGQATSRAPGR